MASFLTLDALSLQNKTVLLRADLNVPMKDGKVTDTVRLERIVPTLDFLKKAGAKIIILSHMGRPDGVRNAKYTLRPVAEALAAVWGQKISFAEDCIGEIAEKAVAALPFGEALVLENTRFYPGEEAGDPVFAASLAKLGDLFVNDAFSAAHRAHASTCLLANLLPAAAGRLMEEELTALQKALEHPARPVIALVGGSKISTKLDLLQNLLTKVDVLVLGGGMANTFLAATGVKVGASLFEEEMVDTARAIMTAAQEAGKEIILPTDVVIAAALEEGVACTTVLSENIPDGQKILDLGAQATQKIKDKIAACRSLVWNGPLGAFEIKPFDRATKEIARFVGERTSQGLLLSVAGGGDTVAALGSLAEKFSYVSTAGGAFLEWLEGKVLPGVEALKNAKK